MKVTGAVFASARAVTEGVRMSTLAAKRPIVKAVLWGLLTLAVGIGPLADLYGQDRPESTAKTPDTERIDRLARQLGSSAFAERAAANKALAEIGEPALPALRRAAASGVDLETRRRVEDLVRTIEQRQNKTTRARLTPTPKKSWSNRSSCRS
ncbi:MAG: hypothetical protein C5B49_08940 [Bdellovibrio sp.]|nr:MAG: hypothetical protein C5B49_08940 [Bdellovibrio sp.]